MPRKKEKNEPLSEFQDTDKTGRVEVELDREFDIIEASIKDDFCNYGYEIIEGVGLGDQHSVKGKGIIDDDLRNAFAALNVHLACLDDVFKHSGIEITDIDKMRSHELAHLYHVTAIKIKGSKDNESVVLVGIKYVSAAGGRIELKTPQVPLDNLSSYKWYNELKVAVDVARNEVALYKEGKYTPVEVEDEEEGPLKQTKMQFMAPEEHEVDADFENAAL